MKIKKIIAIKMELFFLSIAEYILISRNVSRCEIISRRDNNDLYYSGEAISGIKNRIKNNYK